MPIAVRRLIRGPRSTLRNGTVRDYREIYAVSFDTAPDDPSFAESQTGIPRYGDSYPFNPDATVINIDSAPDDDSPYVYYVEVKYSTAAGGNLPPPGDDPTKAPPQISYSVVTEEESVTKDAIGRIIKNSAGVPTDPLTVQRKLMMVRISRLLNSVNPRERQQWVDAINTETFNGFNHYTCRVTNWEANDEDINGVVYVREAWEIAIKLGENDDGTQRTWRTEVLDAGYQELDDKFELVEIKDKYGSPYSRPQLLDGIGKRLKSGKDPVYNAYILTAQADLRKITPALVF